MRPSIAITHIDTACVLLEIDGFRILTDPTLDDAGQLYYHGYGSFSRKTGSPALDADALKNIDLVLLSHHQHKDNFDRKGKAFALTVPQIISTHNAARDIPNVTGLDDWESCVIETPKVKGLKITAAPAQHRPSWLPEFFSGKVIGFIIGFDAQTEGVIYISGDTVFFEGVKEVGRRYKIDIGIYHVGSVQFRYITGFGRYTMNGNDLMKAFYATSPRLMIPIHHKGWSHFKEREQALMKTINDHPLASASLKILQSGVRTIL